MLFLWDWEKLRIIKGHGISEVLPVPGNHVCLQWCLQHLVTCPQKLAVPLANLSFLALNLNQISDNEPVILGNELSKGMSVKIKVWEICFVLYVCNGRTLGAIMWVGVFLFLDLIITV